MDDGFLEVDWGRLSRILEGIHRELTELGVDVDITINLELRIQPGEDPSGVINHGKENPPSVEGSQLLSEAVQDLLRSPWGRGGRSLREIQEALRQNGWRTPKTTLSGLLLWMVKRGKLKRKKEQRGRGLVWIYRTPDEVDPERNEKGGKCLHKESNIDPPSELGALVSAALKLIGDDPNRLGEAHNLLELLKVESVRSTLTALMRLGEASAYTLMRETGLPESTVYRALKRLRLQGLIKEAGMLSPKRRGGPRTHLYTLAQGGEPDG